MQLGLNSHLLQHGLEYMWAAVQCHPRTEWHWAEGCSRHTHTQNRFRCSIINPREITGDFLLKKGFLLVEIVIIPWSILDCNCPLLRAWILVPHPNVLRKTHSLMKEPAESSSTHIFLCMAFRMDLRFKGGVDGFSASLIHQKTSVLFY